MEFHEKLQELRKLKGLTQEQLAEKLYVSRAAVSKWESGRGYPNLDSLKTIANFYSITIDALLSGDEELTIAEESRQQAQKFHNIVFGLLDLSAVSYFFLPFFREEQRGTIQAVSLLLLKGISPYLKAAYVCSIICMILWGILTLVLPCCNKKVSLVPPIPATLLFIISFQPYAAAFGFLLLGIKVFYLLKNP